MQMKKYILRILLTLIIFLFFFSFINGQQKDKNYIAYIETYHNLAIDLMNRYKIPASIILAQGLLESNAGKSYLAKEANNHFGIKCSNWSGKQFYKDDENPDECFRQYENVKESYEDHSRFLSGKSRYAPLFSLKTDDYKDWAKGLLECGYATDKHYATKLIDLIELYELQQYDDPKHFFNRNIYKTFGLVYVIASDSDSFRSIALNLDLKEKNLIKYNEYPVGYRLCSGDIVYLQKKKTKADKPYYEHVVQAGESLHSISQKYGVRLSNLYKMNKKRGQDLILTEGDTIRLR